MSNPTDQGINPDLHAPAGPTRCQTCGVLPPATLPSQLGTRAVQHHRSKTAESLSLLTTFLLARIAEDQERAEFVRSQQVGPGHGSFEPWLLSWQDEYDLLCIEPARALAECAMKRRLVGDFRHLSDMPPDALWAHAAWAVRETAAVYADHPDYRSEWAV